LGIFKTKWFDGFANKNDFHDAALIEAVKRAEKGLVDADLGGGVIKQGVARDGQGKSRGHRVIILFCCCIEALIDCRRKRVVSDYLNCSPGSFRKRHVNQLA